jgi:hypothetical protein
MIKRDELANPNSCINRAADDEMLFVLRGRDLAAPFIIEEWCRLRITIGKNSRIDDPQILEALDCARKMREQQHAEENCLIK